MTASADRIEPTAWLLLAARIVRSLWQGALVVDFTLYLRELGWQAGAISAVLAVALLVGAALTLTVGPLSDRFGRRRFLLAYDAVQTLTAATAFATVQPLALGVAAVLGGFGRGGNGAAGPFSPVEQAWLASCVPATRRGSFYSMNAAGGFLGMGAGALIAALPGWTGGAHPPAGAYRPLFALTALLSAATFVLIACGRDAEAGVPAPPLAAPVEAETRTAENRLLRRLAFANLLNGAGIGLVGPLLAYWFAIRFHRGPAAIGPMMAASFVLAAGGSVATGFVTRRLGIVRTVVWVRALALVFLMALPFAPSFGLAAGLYIGRTILTRATMGARAAVSVGIVRAERRGFSSSIANVALQATRALGPIVAGACFEADLLAAPFLAAALFQGAYIWVYDRAFRRIALR